MTSRWLLLLLSLTLSAAVPAGHVFAQETLADEDAPKPKKKKPKKKGYDYERSRYKSTDLADGQKSQYRFNDKGEPVVEAKKKPAKKKKRSEPPEIGAPGAEACGSEETCIEKKSDADAL